ncbi:MAG: class I SAM-dependent methyltransferase [Tissierellia bacterium]|nr:class I SAM-dependent methyltransferase [Tissierellia bacterium]
MEALQNTLSALQGVEKTMLITLASRAKESRGKKPLFRDWMAEKIYDEAAPFIKEEANPRSVMGTIIRAKAFDECLIPFIEEHPEAICINLGCGLDTRFFRLDNGTIEWYDLDRPAVMTLRDQLIPTHERVTSLYDDLFCEDWIKKVQKDGKTVCILFEGVLQFFTEDEVKKVLALLAENFPGAYVLTDLLSSQILNNPKLMAKLTNNASPFHWGVEDGHDVEGLDPRYHLVRDINLADRMGLKKKWMHLMGKIPKIRRMSSHVCLYKIGE